MTLDEVVAAAKTLSLADHQRAVVRIHTSYQRRLQEERRRLRKLQEACTHLWAHGEEGGGWHWQRCKRCGLEYRWNTKTGD